MAHADEREGGSWLVLQNDGNVVLYNSAQQPIWTTATNGSSNRTL
jgi:hypothetical protein